MQKSLLLLSFLFVIQVYFSQTTKGIAHYKIIMNPIELSSEHSFLKEKIDQNNKACEKISYTLHFNETESYFFAEPILDLEYSLNDLVVISDAKLKVYQNRTTQESRVFNDTRRIGKYIVTEKINRNWVLTNETKTIQSFLCYKAYINPKNNNPKQIITAWFCPKLPLPFGPNNYGDLPGLIIELHTSMHSFLLTDLQLNPQKKIFIDKLLDPTAITQEEVQRRFHSTLTNEQLELLQENKN